MIRRVTGLVLVASFAALAQTITTVAGGGDTNILGDGNLATNASLNQPTSAAFDALGNMYIADYANNRIRKVNKDGVISTVVGTGDTNASGDGAPATSTGIHLPWGLAVDGAGKTYFVERSTHRVRMVDTLGIVHTVAGTGTPGFSGDGGTATGAQLNNPFNVALDSSGNLYIADTLNHRVRKVDTSGKISTVAGTGQGSSSNLTGLATQVAIFSPYDVALDSAGNLYIAEGNRIHEVDLAGTIKTIAGNGNASSAGDGGLAINASFQTPQGLVVDGAGNVFVADTFNNRIRKIDTAGIITTVAGGHIGGIGDGGLATNANVGAPVGVGLDGLGNLYIADTSHGLVRVVKGIAAVGGPTISEVLNGASLQPGISPNSWATIKGSNLSSVIDTWNKAVINGKLPESLDNVTVTVGSEPAYVYYVSSNQINFVVPDVGFGPQQVVVSNSLGTSAAFTVTSAQLGPAFFPWPGNQAVATRQDFTWAVKNGTFAGVTTIASKPGDVIILWGTGFGPTTPVAPVGVQVPADQTYSTSSLPMVTLNDQPVTVYGAALASGNAALCQVAIQVPASLADGDYAVRTTIGGVQSPTGIVLAVRK